MKFSDFNLTIRQVGEKWLVSFVNPGMVIIDEWIAEPPPRHEVEALRDKLEKDAQMIVVQQLEIEQALARGVTTEADAKLKDVGQKLFNWVFSGRVLQSFKDRHSQARENSEGLRIRLSIDPGSSNLGLYPFEIMFCADLPFKDHLALYGGVTIVRSLAGIERFRHPAPIVPPLRILVVGASPRTLPPLNVKREIQNLKSELNLPGIKVESLEDCSIERLSNSAAFEKAHVLHFIGHGEFDRHTNEGKIFLVDRNGQEEPLTGEELRRLLSKVPSIRLVTLNTCLGNASEGAELFSSVATSVFSIEIPAAVVAMQFRITDLAALEFSRCFYSQLALGRPVDDAITSARAHVRRKIRGSPEWATPVLYLGTTDGDFLGLRLSFDQLFSHSVSQLREGNWDIARSTALLAQEQHPDIDVALTRNVIELAEQCEQFSETYLQVTKLLDSGAGEYPSLVIEKFIAQAQDFANGQFARALDDDPGKCREIIHMAEVMTSFGQSDFDQVIELCKRPPSQDLFKFKLIAEQAQAEREAQKELKLLNELWASGDWDMAIHAVEKLCARDDMKRTRMQQTLATKQAVSNVLREAVEALTRNDLKRAQAILQNVPIAEAPANFELSKRAIDIGVEAAECNDPSRITVLKYEIENLLSQISPAVVANTPGVQQVRDRILELGSETDYRTALDLYGKGQFTESRKYFVRLGNYRDSQERTARCDEWIAIIEKLKTRQWDEARRLLTNLRASDKSPRVLSYLHWCNMARTVIPVLEVMANSRFIYDPLIRAEGGENPYKVFSKSGLTPTSTIQECKDLWGDFGKEQRETWDSLRLVPKRLQTDFFLYTVRNPEVACHLAERLCNIEEGMDKELRFVNMPELVAELKEDAGVFLVLRKDYDQAISFFLQEAAARPHDLFTLHHLGLAAAAKIQVLQEQGRDDDQLVQAWENLICGWAAVFANDSFWHDWWATRRRIYDCPISSQEIEDARLQLQRLWLDRIKSATDICPGLDVVFRAELSGALAANAGKGIPLPDHPGEVAVVGLFGAKSLRLLSAVADWTASFGEKVLERESLQRTCEYFSELAEPLALFQDGRYEEVIDMLTRPRCEQLKAGGACKQVVPNDSCPRVANIGCPCFADANPGFAKLPNGGDLLLTRAYDLLEKAHCKVAVSAVSVTPLDNMKALRHWKTAIDLARRHGDVEDVLMGIRNDIVGRANVLMEAVNIEDEASLDVLFDAVELLQLSYDEGWDNSDKVLRLTLVDLLLLRAYFHSNVVEEHEKARRDAIQAYGMEPQHLRAIHVLCKVNWFYAWRLHDRGLKSAAEALIREIEATLKEGDELYPDDRDLAACHKDLKELRDYMAEVKGVTLESLMKNTSVLPETTFEQQRLSKLAEASYAEAQKNFAEAIKLYEGILRKDPDDNEVKARMAYCYNSWILYERDNGFESPERIRQITREAVTRFPDSELFAGFAGLVNEE